MKHILFSIFAFLSITLYSSNPKIKLFLEENFNGESVFVDNPYKCPISVKITYKLNNLESRSGNGKTYVIPPTQKRWLVDKLIKIDLTQPRNYSYSYTSYFGDFNKKGHSKDYNYDLPFSKSKSYKISQGYNGKFSHQNKNSLDFVIPMGGEIKAIREGLVVEVIDKNKKSCEKKKCAKYNNYIVIYHSDGSYAEYHHIQKNSALVKVGDRISKSKSIAYCGSTGWARGPHLHLTVYSHSEGIGKTIKTKFRTGDGSKSEYLQEGKNYIRNY